MFIPRQLLRFASAFVLAWLAWVALDRVLSEARRRSARS